MVRVDSIPFDTMSPYSFLFATKQGEESDCVEICILYVLEHKVEDDKGKVVVSVPNSGVYERSDRGDSQTDRYSHVKIR